MKQNIAPFKVLKHNNNPINAIAFSKNSNLLSGDTDGVLLLWNLNLNRLSIPPIVAHTNSILTVDMVQEDKFLSLGRDGYCNIWDVDSLNAKSNPIVKIESGSNHFCNACVIQALGSNIIITPSGDPSQVLLWDVRAPHQPMSTITQVVPNSNDTTTTGSKNHGMVTCLSTFIQTSTQSRENEDCIQNITHDKKIVKKDAIQPEFDETNGNSNGNEMNSSQEYLMIGYEDGSLAAYDFRKMSVIGVNSYHKDPIFAIASSPKRNHILTGGADIQIIRSKFDPHYSIPSSEPDIDTNTLMKSNQQEKNKPISGLHALLNNQKVSYPLVLEIPLIDAINLKYEGTSSIKYRNDGRIIVSGHWDATIRIYDQKKLKPLAVLRHHRESVLAIAFASNSSNNTPTDNDVIAKTTFASASKDGSIAFWSLFADTYRNYE
eukprot:gene7733-10508_t